MSTHGPLLTCVGGDFPCDIVVCAPTGCGKTLAYAVPIVSALLKRHVPQVNCSTVYCVTVSFFFMRQSTKNISISQLLVLLIIIKVFSSICIFISLDKNMIFSMVYMAKKLFL